MGRLYVLWAHQEIRETDGDFGRILERLNDSLRHRHLSIIQNRCQGSDAVGNPVPLAHSSERFENPVDESSGRRISGARAAIDSATIGRFVCLNAISISSGAMSGFAFARADRSRSVLVLDPQ